MKVYAFNDIIIYLKLTAYSHIQTLPTSLQAITT